MKYNQPYGVSDPNAAYVNGDPSVGRMGSIPPAESIEYPQREIVAVISDTGITPSNADNTQLAKAIQSGGLNKATDTGTANNLSIVLSPAPDAYRDGMAVWVQPANNNTGPAVINVNGLGNKNIIRRGGAVLVSGDLPASYKSLLVYNGSNGNFELYGVGFGAGGGPPVLIANSNLYVNTATGDDALYDGTSATVSGPHGPFKTIARAVNETFKYGPSVYTMTINVAAGTYAENVLIPDPPGPAIIISGAGTSTLVTGANNVNTFFVSKANTLTIQNLYADCNRTSSVGPLAIFASVGALNVQNCRSGSSLNNIFESFSGGTIKIYTHEFASGSACDNIYSTLAGYMNVGVVGTASTHTFLGPMTVRTATANSSQNGALGLGPSLSFAGGSNVGGARYSCTLNGVIAGTGGNVNAFPGNVAGSTSSGGQYG